VFEFGDKKGFEQKNIHEAKKFLEKNDIAGFKNFMFNSLEQVVVENYQSINDFKKILIDKLGSSGLIMTGSGSTFIKIIGKNEDFSHFTTEYKVNYLVKTYNFL
jgi:4-diphosphocytidyl-2C-methyl-D-erythritol kinase